MDLAAILAARKQNKPATPATPPINEEDISYLGGGKYLPNLEINPLFLACLTPLIRFPYQLYSIHNEYYWWLLSPDDNVHVLNTFYPISDQVLFDAYMEYNPPKTAHDLHKLYVTITRICFNMPPIYLPSILNIIKGGENKLGKFKNLCYTFKIELPPEYKGNIMSDETEIEEMTYSELLATAMMNDEIVITIANEDVERVKIGIKNVKAKQAAKLKEEGLVPDPSILNFYISEVNEDGDVELKIVLSRKSVVRVKHIHIPDGEF